MAGGAELHLHEILKHCVAAGHEVDLCVCGYPGAPAAGEIDGVRVHRRGHWLVANLTVPGLVRDLLRRRSYDLIVEDINKIPFLTPLYSRGTPVCGIVPHLFGTTVYRETNPLFATYVYLAERMIPAVYRDVDFEVISPSTADDLVARGIPRGRIRTILCGMNHQRFTLADPPPRTPPGAAETPLVVSWSRLRRYKSIDVAIRAFDAIRRRLPGARMLVMGRGPDEQRLRRLTTRLGLDDAVEFAGFLPWDDLVRTLHRAHVFLNPSPKEGWGLTVIEANQCGVPVVASDAPGLRDSVRDGETGFLTPYADHEAMAARALEILADDALWTRLHEAAVAWAGTFSWSRCAADSLALFREIADRSAAGAARDRTDGADREAR